ncbi:glycoside hydrolase family 3 protein [Aspergillus stella-maris]|uniref:glycoside hydrolase family 3 protein n=1 Tax=Aspergillus stella-maris TaxID=1810926 RepID=UPI003CCCE1E1
MRMKVSLAGAPGATWNILLLTFTFASYILPLTAVNTVTDPSVSTNSQPWLNTSLDTETRLQSFLAELTFDEKLAMVQGNKSAETNACIGYIPSIPRLSMPAICMGDGPEGVGNNLGNVTTFPAPILTASTWNSTLNELFGRALGAEHKSKGRNIVLAPTINIIRSPLWGRAAESISEDPYLTSRIAVAVTRGIQEGNNVVACVKHFAAYNQETNRFGLAPGFDAVDAIVDERVLREVYFPAFKASIQEGNAGSVMCAYNKVNGEHACESSFLLNDVLKNDWGFDGFVVTDWYFAQRSTVKAALAGLDNSQPGGDWMDYYGFPDFFGSLLEDALENGSVPESRVEDMVERLWRPVFEVGGIERPSVGLEGIDNVARTEEHLDLAQRIVEEGAVLLKNEGVLPLGQGQGEKTIAIFGADAADQAAVTELHGGFVLDTTMIVQKPVDYIRARAKQENITVLYSEAYPGTNEFPTIPSSMFGPLGLNVTYWTTTDFSGHPNRTIHAENITSSSYPADIGANWPDVFSSRYGGTFYPNVTGRHHFSLSGNGGGSLYLNGDLVATMPGSNFGVVVQGFADLKAGSAVPIRFDYSMGYSVDPGTYGITVGVNVPPQNTSLYGHAVSTAQSADVSIIFVNDAHTEGLDSSLALRLPGDQEEMISLVAKHSKKTIVVLNTNAAILMPWLDDVDAVIESFYSGQQVGSAMARLLFGDVNFSGKLPVTFPASYEDSPTSSLERFPGVNLTANYEEGLYVGYKWYDEFEVAPLFPFGYGLSYTAFEIGGLAVTVNSTIDGFVRVKATVENIGPVFGKEIVQLYVSYPDAADEPPKLLRRFEKVALDTGEVATVVFVLSREELSIWNTEQGGWMFVPGEYEFLVGSSSRDIAEVKKVGLY